MNRYVKIACASAPVTASMLGFLTRPCCSIPFFLSLAGLGSSSLVLMLKTALKIPLLQNLNGVQLEDKEEFIVAIELHL